MNGKTAKHPGGAPTDYDPSFLPRVTELARDGATDIEIADYIGVSVRTIHRWKAKHREFRHSLKMGKKAADARVKRSLYQKAVGYSFESVKIFADPKTGSSLQVPYIEHVPPSDTAAIFWLKNRQSSEWRDKIEQVHSGSVQLVNDIPRPPK